MSKEPRARSKDIHAKITTVGRPLRLEVVLNGPWLERLKAVLRSMEGGDGAPYALQRYLEELIEADIVYREALGSRGPFLSRPEIMHWLHRRHAGTASRRGALASRR